MQPEPTPVDQPIETSELARAREDALAWSARALRAEHRAEGFVHMVHEIRTLLGAVSGLSTMLLDSSLAGGQRDHVKRLRASGAALLEVVNGVLDFSKLEAGALVVDSTEFDLRKKLEEVAALAADRADAKRVEVVTTVDSDVPPNVVGDGVRLRHALLNLVINAIKFTNDGHIVIRARMARGITASRPDQVFIAIDVTDTGCGIPGQALSDIFQPFHQAGTSPAARSAGTGLGLTIVRAFVEAMGGRVACQSRVGQGSRFTVTLPLGRGNAQEVLGARTDFSGRHLVIVEPIAAARSDLEAVSRRLGLHTYAFATTGDARDWINFHDHVSPDFIAIGVAPPDTTWPESVRELARIAPDAKLIVATHLSQPLPSALGPLVARHLYKPFRRHRFVSALEACLATPDVASKRSSASGGARPRAKLASLLETGEFSRLTALVVEDDPVNARVAAYLLEKRGWAVEHAADGREAVQRLASKSYNLVLLDWHTPRLDGLSAAREIRAQEAPGQRTAIVALTAVATEGARQQCFDAGMDDFLAKPFVERDLDAILGRVVAGAYSKNFAKRPNVPALKSTFDKAALAMLIGEGANDAEWLQKLGSIFAEAVPRRMRELQTGIERRDRNLSYLAAHSLRGMCGQVAATALSNRFTTLEDQAKAGAFDALAQVFPSVEREVRGALEEIAVHFGGGSAAIRAAS